MSDLHELGAFMRSVENTLASVDRSDDWASRSNRASLRALHAEVRDAWIAGQKGLRAHFEHGEVVGHAGPAHLVLRAAQALNDAVVAAANRHLARPFPKLDDRARSRLGMWLVPVAPGSIVIDLVCQPSNARDPELRDDVNVQMTLDVADAIETISMRAVDEVARALQGAQHSEGAVERVLAERLSALGVPATRQIDRFAARCVDLGSTVQLDDRTGAPAIELTPADAVYLRRVIRSMQLDVEVVTYEGMWITASEVRTTFDLQVSDGSRVTGIVPRTLLAASSAEFKHHVRIEVDESVRDGDDDPVIRRTLRSIERIDPPDDPAITDGIPHP